MVVYRGKKISKKVIRKDAKDIRKAIITLLADVGLTPKEARRLIKGFPETDPEDFLGESFSDVECKIIPILEEVFK